MWDSGIGLSSWLVELAQLQAADREHSAIARARDALFSTEKRNVIELGARYIAYVYDVQSSLTVSIFKAQALESSR